MTRYDARSIDSLTKTIIDNYIVSEMGSDYYHNHDGWDNHNWPGNNLTFRVWSDENNFEDYSVLLEYDPVFYARKIF